jgi:chromosome partitioning protein
MHLIVALLRHGYQVGAIDLKGCQATLSGYLATRQAFARTKGIDLPPPRSVALECSTLDSRAATDAEETARFNTALGGLADCDIVVIDCSGSDTFRSRLGHGHADTPVTPINDSFVDFAMLAKAEPDDHAVVHPSICSEMVWEACKRRFARGCDRARSARCLTGGVAAVGSAALYGVAVFRLPT